LNYERDEGKKEINMLPVYKQMVTCHKKPKQENWRIGHQILISETHHERNQSNDDDTQGIIKFIGNGS
jgi:hypothetical protein